MYLFILRKYITIVYHYYGTRIYEYIIISYYINITSRVSQKHIYICVCVIYIVSFSYFNCCGYVGLSFNTGKFFLSALHPE